MTTVLLGTVFVAPSFLYMLYAMAILNFPQGYGLFAMRVLKPAIGGFFEELFRSSLVIIFSRAKYKYVRLKTTDSSAYINVLDSHILGLALLYSVIESSKLIRDAFSSRTPDSVQNIIGVSVTAANDIVDINLIFIPVIFIGIIFRYYLHLKLLQFSVYALAAKKYFLFILALLTHFLNNFLLLYSVKYSIESLIIRMVIVEIIMIVAISFLLEKLKLREQIISNEDVLNPQTKFSR